MIRLGEVSAYLAASVYMLAVSCNRCDRRGGLLMDQLLAEHGPDLPILDLRRIVAADCPRMVAGEMHEECGIHFPGLSG